MSQANINLTVLGLDIAFRPGADLDRIQRAASLVEKRFAEQKLRSQGQQSRDILLTFLALGFADDLLQMKTMQNELRQRLVALLARIEKSV